MTWLAVSVSSAKCAPCPKRPSLDQACLVSMQDLALPAAVSCMLACVVDMRCEP